MSKICIQYMQTPVGELILGEYENKLCLADWRYGKASEGLKKRLEKAFKAEFVEQETAVLRSAKVQLAEYFSGKRKTFDVPLLFVGTTFQKSIWEVLMAIDFGQTCSYLDVAKSIDNQKAVRAVANAVGTNPLAIFAPCHRIIGSDGSLTGYAGGLDAKQKLLALESNGFTL